MILKCVSSKEILQRRFLSMYAFVGAHLISYENVVTQSFPFPSPISRLYRSKAGMMILIFPVGCPFVSSSWWIMSLQSSSSRLIHIRWSWILLRSVTLCVTIGLISTKKPSECSNFFLAEERVVFLQYVEDVFHCCNFWVLNPLYYKDYHKMSLILLDFILIHF